MTRRLAALALLALIAFSATGATYYISPTGTYGRTPTRDGSAWTDDKALTVAWANDSAVAGDLVRMKIGAYNADIRPRNSGLPSTAKRITFFGNLDTLNGVVVNNVTVDSSDGATQGITVKGVRVLGDVSFRSLGVGSPIPGTVAGYDTLLSCTVLGSLLNNGRSNVTIKTCNIGDGTERDYFHFGNGFGTGTWSRNQHMDSLYVADCTFRLASDTKNNAENVISSHGVSNSTIERCRFFISGLPGSGDYSLQTHYDSKGVTFRDCYFEGRYNGLPANSPMYLLNMRDNQVNNVWERDTLVEASDSPLPLRVYFQSDGNLLDATVGGTTTTYDYGDSNNTFVDNVVKVRGPIYLDSPLAKYTFHGNVLATAASLKLCNTFAREITFRHNTVFTSGSVALDASSKLWNSTIAHNIFACAQAVGGTSGGGPGEVGVYCIDTAIQDGAHYRGTILIPVIPGTVGVVDSNLYYSAAQANPDSFRTIDMSATQGGGAKQHHNRDSWFHTYGHDGASHWGSPGFTSLDPLAFDPQPSTSSLAYSTDLWADQYVGALTLPDDVTAPVVTMSEPSGSHLWAAGEVMTIAWTATDNTAVTSLILEYGKGTSPVTWYPIATPVVGTTSYLWTCPAFLTRYATVRVRALDAESNEGSATRYFQCNVRFTDPEGSRDTP